jgi:Spy/CpxP family protein refolding chaperone
MKNKLLLLPLTAAALLGAASSASASADSLTAERDALKSQLSEIESELARCDKQRKGWIVGTVIGAAGVVGTAVGVGVQAKQLKDKKSELKELQAEKDSLGNKGE